MQYQSWYITGASSGIGEAFARLAPHDTRLLLSGQNEERLLRISQDLQTHIKILPGDLTLAAEREAAILAAEEAKIDLLILNAGIGQLGPALENPPKREMEMMLLNMVAPIEMVRALAPGMIERAKISGRRAGIILVSSVAAFMPIPYFSTYAATKAFLKNFGEAFCYEIRNEPIDCLTLCPGTTRTRFFERANAKKMLSDPGVMSPRQVAKEGLSALGKKNMHIVGLGNKMIARAIALLPHGLTVGLAGFIMRKRMM